ncbi:hypothetical protein HDU82_009284 [Entophlyctis luteolus]|nr:hypothetical protein HDU82_009284 [Entophlyctis luteolus]
MVRVGCVPEHFSAPFLALPSLPMPVDSSKAVHAEPVDLVFCPGGTGQMLELLRTNSLDVCVCLTEGIFASLAKGNPADIAIIGVLTHSPLTWAIVSHPDSTKPGNVYADALDGPHPDNAALIRGTRVGISRFGSGSHLIPFLVAQSETPASVLTPPTTPQQQNEQEQQQQSQQSQPPEFQFVQLNDFAGLRAGISAGTADCFLWERFTTQSHISSGALHHLSSITPPWPAFVVVARRAFVTEHADVTRALVSGISRVVRERIKSQESRDAVIDEICVRFGYNREHVVAWFEGVEFADDVANVDRTALARCLRVLEGAGAVQRGSAIHDDWLFVYGFVVSLRHPPSAPHLPCTRASVAARIAPPFARRQCRRETRRKCAQQRVDVTDVGPDLDVAERLIAHAAIKRGPGAGARKGRPKSSLYTGVSWFADQRKWLACIKIRGVQFNLGLHNSQIQAARAFEAVSRAREDILDLWDGFSSPAERAAHIMKMANPDHKQRVRTSQFRGVLRVAGTKKFRVKTRIDKQQYSLGCYASEKLAARVYQRVASMRRQMAASLATMTSHRERATFVRSCVDNVIAELRDTLPACAAATAANGAATFEGEGDSDTAGQDAEQAGRGS